MENFILEKDINLICVRATSFPLGITEAFKKLEQAHASIPGRTFFGISHGSDTGILYWAAAESKSKTEASTLGLESYTIKKGNYITETLKNLKGNEKAIGDIFNTLLRHPKLDETGECIEWYKGTNEVLCMVRIRE